jgi:hypothetical protein
MVHSALIFWGKTATHLYKTLLPALLDKRCLTASDHQVLEVTRNLFFNVQTTLPIAQSKSGSAGLAVTLRIVSHVDSATALSISFREAEQSHPPLCRLS